MMQKQIIGLHRREQMIALGAYGVLFLSLFLPFASVGGTTFSAVRLAFRSVGFLYGCAALLGLLLPACGLFLRSRPSIKGVRLWAVLGALETLTVTCLLFASKRALDASGLFPGSFMVRNFSVGFWLLLLSAYVGLHYAMKATKVSTGYIVLTILSVIWLFPIVWIVLTSFRGEGGYYVGYFIPKTFTLENYIALFRADSVIPFGRWWLNTFIVAAVSGVMCTLVVLMTAYCLSRLRFSGRTTLMKAMMVIGMFPGFMSMIAVYNILKGMGISQSLGALILVNVAGAAMGYYICKGFMDTVPRAMDEAATIDGATRFTIFAKIMIPMAKPIIIYQLMTAFLAPWGDYIFPSLLMGDRQESYTVALGLKWLTDFRRINNYYTQFAAGAVLVAVPIVVLFVSLQRYYVEGMAGSVKG